MKRFNVYYESRVFGNTYIQVFANSQAEAEEIIERDGVGHDGETIFADKITKVEEVK